MLIGTLYGDVRLGLRRLRTERRLVSAAVLTLGIGIGVSTAMFSVVNAVLLRPMGVGAPQDLLVMWPQLGDSAGEFTYNAFRALRSRTTVLDGIAVASSSTWPEEIQIGDSRLRTAQSAVSSEFFDVLRARPALGRTFRSSDDEPGSRNVVILSAALWTKYFGGNNDVLGRVLLVGGKGGFVPFEIVGVMPSEFFYPSGADYWIPAVPALARSTSDGSADSLEKTFDGLGVFHTVARVKPGIGLAAAAADASRVIDAMPASAGVGSDRSRVVARPFLDHIFGRARRGLIMLMGAVVLVLLVACANVAGLLIASGLARGREMAVRTALGATTWHLIRQLLAEGALIAILGAAFGIVVASLALRGLVAVGLPAIPRLNETTLDLDVMLFVAVVTTVTTLIISLVPAWHIRSSSLSSRLQGASKGVVGRGVRGRPRQVMVMAQITVALILAMAGALIVQSAARLARVDLGFEPSHVLTFSVSGLDDARYPAAKQRLQLTDRLISTFERLPGIDCAAAVLVRPFAHGVIGWDSAMLLEGQTDTLATWLRNPVVNWEAVTPQYFEAMKIRLARGRWFVPADSTEAPLVVVVSESTAARAWPGQDPIGKRLMDSFVGRGDDTRKARWQTVVGIVADSRYREIERVRPDLYVPLAQSGGFNAEHFVVRTTIAPKELSASVVAALTSVDAALTIEEPTTMEDVVARVVAPWRFNTLLFGVFALVSMALTATGVFGLVAHMVSGRRHEIALRLALGARPGQVVGMIVFEGVRLIAVGLAAGLVTALLGGQIIGSLLFEISPTDPATAVAGTFAVLAIAGLACYLPARRAALLDPASVFRDH